MSDAGSSTAGDSPAGDTPALTILAGGYGGAKLSHGVVLAAAARERAGHAGPRISIVVNVADDLELHGLHVSPDLDTVMYTLAGLANEETGWGVRDETWSTAGMLERYGAPTWFRLGDRDMATHVRRTEMLRAGRRLTEVTAELSARLGVDARLLPVTDDVVRTRLRSGDGWLDFQDYFVRRGQRDRVDEIRHDGIEEARPTPEVRDAIASAALILIAPSNPFVSVGPILSTPGLEAALRAAPADVVAVSPVVGGQALRGPADRMLASLGYAASARGVVDAYADRSPGLVDVWVLDEVDEEDASALRDRGVIVETLDTVMRDVEARERLATAILDRHLPV